MFGKRRISTYSPVAVITGLLIIVLATLERYARRSVYVEDIARFIG